MSLNRLIQVERPTVAMLVQGLGNKELFVDNSFQRRLVWTEKQKVRLIETVLMGYPMPEVYLWQQPADPDTGQQKRSIVDGQQRLTAMQQFVANEWPLSAKYLDEPGSPYTDLKWKDMPAELRQTFWDYVVNARIIPSDINDEQIKAIFQRLNETDRSLNPQELRNAKFNGLFIATAEQAADLEELQKLNVFTDTQIRRMGDIQFTSSLLMFMRRGLVEENVERVNETYDMYNDIYEEAEDDLAELRRFFSDCDAAYITDTSTRKMFTKPVHLYTLFGLDQTLKQQDIDRSVIPDKLTSFTQLYDADGEDDELIAKYRQGASSRTASRASRSLRLSSLIRWVQQD